MFESLDKIISLLVRIAQFFVSPIRIELHSLSYVEIENSPSDSCYIITGYPRSYVAEFSLTNKRTDKAVYGREASLLISGRPFAEYGDITNLRLEPGERKTISTMFPVDNEETPETEGKIVLTVTPAIGRPAKFVGHFPISESD